jgi:hypothetical protein
MGFYSVKSFAVCRFSPTGVVGCFTVVLDLPFFIDCVTKENVHIVDSFVPESRVFGNKGGSTEALRIGFSGGTEEIITEYGIKRYEVANRIRHFSKSQD